MDKYKSNPHALFSATDDTKQIVVFENRLVFFSLPWIQKRNLDKSCHEWTWDPPYIVSCAFPSLVWTVKRKYIVLREKRNDDSSQHWQIRERTLLHPTADLYVSLSSPCSSYSTLCLSTTPYEWIWWSAMTVPISIQNENQPVFYNREWSWIPQQLQHKEHYDAETQEYMPGWIHVPSQWIRHLQPTGDIYMKETVCAKECMSSTCRPLLDPPFWKHAQVPYWTQDMKDQQEMLQQMHTLCAPGLEGQQVYEADGTCYTCWQPYDLEPLPDYLPTTWSGIWLKKEMTDDSFSFPQSCCIRLYAPRRKQYLSKNGKTRFDISPSYPSGCFDLDGVTLYAQPIGNNSCVLVDRQARYVSLHPKKGVVLNNKTTWTPWQDREWWILIEELPVASKWWTTCTFYARQVQTNMVNQPEVACTLIAAWLVLVLVLFLFSSFSKIQKWTKWTG